MSANETPSIPFPPEELLQRTGNVDRADPERAYDAIGKAIRSQIEGILPSDWSWSGIRVLDFGCGAGRVLRQFISEASSSEFWGCDIDHPSIEWINENLCPPLHALACNEEPGLDLPDGFFNLIYSISVFTHLTKHSAGWLIELHRVLAPEGLLLVSFLGEGMTQPLLNESWQEERIGFNAVLHGNPWNKGGPLTFLSPWWVREHWGRAFEVVTLLPATHYDRDTGSAEGHGLVLLRKKPVTITAEEIERVAPGDPRELMALQHNVEQLVRETLTLRAHIANLESQQVQSADLACTTPLDRVEQLVTDIAALRQQVSGLEARHEELAAVVGPWLTDHLAPASLNIDKLSRTNRQVLFAQLIQSLPVPSFVWSMLRPFRPWRNQALKSAPR